MTNPIEEEILWDLQALFDSEMITAQDETELISLESAKSVVEEAFKKQKLIGWYWLGYEGEYFFRKDEMDTQGVPSEKWLEMHKDSITPLYGTPHHP